MAKKRMFRLDVLETDAFLDMPLSTQALYFHLNLRADDDGFIGNPKQIVRLIGANQNDLDILVAKRFVLTFQNGVIVIKHWRMHNTLAKDRYVETKYLEEKSMLRIKDNKSYTFGFEGDQIDDSRLLEMSKRQQTNNRRTIDEQKTTERQPIDDQKTTPDKDIDIDKDIGIAIGIALEEVKDKDKESLRDTDVSLCGTEPHEKEDVYEEIVRHWNTLPDPIAKIAKISSRGDRRKLLNARIKDYGIENIHNAIEEIPKSDFLMGKGNKGWSISFDWFVRPNNFPKVLEGNYRGRIKGTTTTGNSYVDAISQRFDPVVEFMKGEDGS